MRVSRPRGRYGRAAARRVSVNGRSAPGRAGLSPGGRAGAVAARAVPAEVSAGGVRRCRPPVLGVSRGAHQGADRGRRAGSGQQAGTVR